MLYDIKINEKDQFKFVAKQKNKKTENEASANNLIV